MHAPCSARAKAGYAPEVSGRSAMMTIRARTIGATHRVGVCIIPIRFCVKMNWNAPRTPCVWRENAFPGQHSIAMIRIPVPSTSASKGSGALHPASAEETCEDGLACNGPDTCILGQCVGEPCSCVLGSDCGPGALCWNAPDCVDGVCVAGTAVECPDGGPCTELQCDSGTGECTAALSDTGTPVDPGSPAGAGEPAMRACANPVSGVVMMEIRAQKTPVPRTGNASFPPFREIRV